MDNEKKKITDNEFWKTIFILLKNIPAIHKKICGVVDIQRYAVLNGISKLNSTNFQDKFYINMEETLCNYGVKFEMCNSIEEFFNEESRRKSIEGILFVRKLLLKSLKSNAIYSLQTADFLNNEFTQICVSDEFKKAFSYKIRLKSEHLDTIPLFPTEHTESWCNNVLKSKFLNWYHTCLDEKPLVCSHKLIDTEKYVQFYKQLKQKYGDQLMQSWKESTDPKKFIYEDIGIASYLILLWKESNNCKYFVDLGCGNGLLVYILNAEGYSGHGIDIKRRKIWNSYPSSVKLVEQAIDPTTFHLNNNDSQHIDWIIGNHSDELSAWIPVISAMISYETKYFLLPCCAYELSGAKFQRRNSKMSVYNDFLQYIEKLSNNCGFVTLSDRLKIPSTKRIAYIGMQRTYKEEEFPAEYAKLYNIFSSEFKEDKIKLRIKEQSVRNCTQINKSIVDRIVLTIFNFLLTNNDKELSKSKDLVYWNSGQSTLIIDLIKRLTKEDLKILKSECGGLKTLLKNKHEIFNIENDKVSIKRPQNKCLKKGMITKKRKCFFFYNHPNGCPLSYNDCTFLHDDDL